MLNNQLDTVIFAQFIELICFQLKSNALTLSNLYFQRHFGIYTECMSHVSFMLRLISVQRESHIGDNSAHSVRVCVPVTMTVLRASVSMRRPDSK